MKKKDNEGYWHLKLGIIIFLTVMYCGLLPQSVYAEENKQDVVKIVPTLTITLQDEDGNPISGVTLLAMEGRSIGAERDNAKTDENGKAVFKHLPSGTYYFFANIKAIRKHVGYGLPALVREFKTSSSYYISEVKAFDLHENVEDTYTIKKGAYIWFETFLDIFKPGKIVVMNQIGIQQIIPVAGIDYMQIYMPMRMKYAILTIKDNDFDSWIIEFYAHEGLQIELL